MDNVLFHLDMIDQMMKDLMKDKEILIQQLLTIKNDNELDDVQNPESVILTVP